MNNSILMWSARICVAILAILGVCYVFDIILEGPSTLLVIVIVTAITIALFTTVFEYVIIRPLMKWTNEQKISILRKREDEFQGDYAPETKPELPGGPIKRKSNSYNKSKTVRKPKTNRVTNNKKKN
jgi:hypothetical protein